MEYSITVGTIIGLMGAAFAVITFLKSRDKETKLKTKEDSERDSQITELRIRLELYQQELLKLQSRVDNLDLKLMDEIKALAEKIDKIMMKLMEK